MIDELVKAVRLHLSERLTSPLMGAFAVSWLAWNYRLLIIIFSGEPVEHRFSLIQEYLYSSYIDVLSRGVAFPAITAAAYLFIYPYPAKIVYAFTRRRQREILEIRRKIEDETPLTIEDSRQIRSQLAKERREYYEDMERKDFEIDRLKKEIEETLSRPPSGAEKKAQPVDLDLDQSQLDMLINIESWEGGAPEGHILIAAGPERTEDEYNIGELLNKRLIERLFVENKNQHVFRLTHAGRGVLIRQRGEKVTI